MIGLWKQHPIVSVYEVDVDGDIRRIGSAEPIQPYRGPRGHWYVGLYVGGSRIKRKVAQMVADTFMEPAPSPNHVIAHIDGDLANYEVGNLVWRPALAPTSHKGNARLTEDQVKTIRAEAASGWKYTQLAVKYGVTESNIRAIVTGLTWHHVP
jgi:hypothetical protein